MNFRFDGKSSSRKKREIQSGEDEPRRPRRAPRRRFRDFTTYLVILIPVESIIYPKMSLPPENPVHPVWGTDEATFEKVSPILGAYGLSAKIASGCYPHTRPYQARSQKKSLLRKSFKNVGSVRFELTIDGSLRHASVLQRVITDSADPLFIIHTGRERPLEPVAIPD